MDYKFLDEKFDIQNVVLPESDKINPFLLKNSTSEILKSLDFLNSEETLLYIHGFLGTGKRQFINYLTEFFDKDVVKLEYYCKPSTVCDDILLSFINVVEKLLQTKNVNLNVKITTLNVKFQQHISVLKKPYVIILHSFDDVLEENRNLISDFLLSVASNPNLKIILSTRAMMQNVVGELPVDKKVFLKGFTKEIFKEYLNANKIEYSDTALEDFYKYTRGYYYYTALVIKIIYAMKLSLHEFLEKFALSGMNFDSYLGATYINLVPASIRNFFWFLRTVRHGLTLNALAVFELYDEFSIEYLKTNLMIFQADETIYVQDYFQQDIDISIPPKTEIKLHKYIISIYERELKEPLQTRSITISRQALRAEIEYHNKCIENVENGSVAEEKAVSSEVKEEQKQQPIVDVNLDNKIKEAARLADENNYTPAIEAYLKIIEEETLDSNTLVTIRIALARLYKEIEDFKNAQHYYELAETYYKQNNEVINLNYLYYELTDLYFLMYKNERAIETVKKVVYSVDTPQSLLVSASTLLGNIYYNMQNPDEAEKYYLKALESLDENTSESTLAELYFKYALVNDEKNEYKIAYEYYTKCITIGGNNPYKALAYSNLGSCYYDNDNYSDAKDCFKNAYDIEKSNNNYEGIYYASLYLAKIFEKENSSEALKFFIEAKQSAEFINEDFYILESGVALGDYYYNNISRNKSALQEYFKAKKVAERIGDFVDIDKIEKRINDMKHRMDISTFNEIKQKYE